MHGDGQRCESSTFIGMSITFKKWNKQKCVLCERAFCICAGLFLQLDLVYPAIIRQRTTVSSRIALRKYFLFLKCTHTCTF